MLSESYFERIRGIAALTILHYSFNIVFCIFDIFKISTGIYFPKNQGCLPMYTEKNRIVYLKIGEKKSLDDFKDYTTYIKLIKKRYLRNSFFFFISLFCMAINAEYEYYVFISYFSLVIQLIEIIVIYFGLLWFTNLTYIAAIAINYTNIISSLYFLW